MAITLKRLSATHIFFNKSNPSYHQFSILFNRQKYKYGSLQFDKLHDTPKGNKPRRPKGRGPNNKVGLGHKGSKVRQGNRRQSHRGFEGGQTPIHIASPRIGWHKYDHYRALNWLDLEKIERWIERGALNKNKIITMHDLVKSRCFNSENSAKLFLKYGLSLINNTKEYEIFPYKINIEVTFVTPSTKKAIENAGGTVRLKHYHFEKLIQSIFPHHYEFIPKEPLDSLPKPRWRHYFPDYPQLPIKDDLQYLGRFQVHPELLPKNVDDEEIEEQEKKLKLAKKRFPKSYYRRPTDLKTKLYKWSKPN